LDAYKGNHLVDGRSKVEWIAILLKLLILILDIIKTSGLRL